MVPQDAEEVVQEVFVSLWERRSELDITGSIDAYLHTAVRYRIYNRYRDYLKRKKTFLIPGLDDVDYQLAAAELMEYRELESRVASAVGSLPAKCREVFLLSREEKLSHKMIAARLGISVNTVEKHIGKALQLLRIQLKNEMVLVLVGSAVLS